MWSLAAPIALCQGQLTLEKQWKDEKNEKSAARGKDEQVKVGVHSAPQLNASQHHTSRCSELYNKGFKVHVWGVLGEKLLLKS